MCDRRTLARIIPADTYDEVLVTIVDFRAPMQGVH
jgi:hypothetical protein